MALKKFNNVQQQLRPALKPNKTNTWPKIQRPTQSLRIFLCTQYFAIYYFCYSLFLFIHQFLCICVHQCRFLVCERARARSLSCSVSLPLSRCAFNFQACCIFLHLFINIVVVFCRCLPAFFRRRRLLLFGWLSFISPDSYLFGCTQCNKQHARYSFACRFGSFAALPKCIQLEFVCDWNYPKHVSPISEDGHLYVWVSVLAVIGLMHIHCRARNDVIRCVFTEIKTKRFFKGKQ